MTDDEIRKEIIDSSIYTLIIMGNYRKADEILRNESYEDYIYENNRKYYDSILKEKLERGLD